MTGLHMAGCKLCEYDFPVYEVHEQPACPCIWLLVYCMIQDGAPTEWLKGPQRRCRRL